MNLIDRYIARSIWAATAVVALVVAAIALLLLFIGEIDHLGEGDYGLARILAYMTLYLPARLYLVWPVLALLGALLALGALAAGSELVVIRGAGVSMWRLAGSVSIAAIALALISVVLGECLAPVGVHTADRLRANALHPRTAGSIDNGLWLRQGNTIVRINATLPGGRIDGIEVYELSENGQLQRAISADHAVLRDHRLILAQPRYTRIATDHTRTGAPDRLALPIDIDPEVLSLAVTRPEELAIPGLWRYIGYLERNHIDASNYRLALWRDIFNPLTIWAMCVFALPFAFGSLRSASAGQRLFLGGLVGLAFFLVNEIVASAGPVYGLAPWLAAGLPTTLLAAATLAWIRRLS